jgi:eukaryotic-like serine/threonine-protein kinase
MISPRNPDWWPRLDAVFQGALEVPPGQRATYLDRMCGADTDLRAEVEAMLAVDEPDRALSIERLVHDAAPLPEPDPFIGMRLGPWRVVARIGHGGMGTVYLAERADGQYEQRVALKLVRGSAQQPGSTRFKAEAYILARLSHPNIARLFDAGFTPEGSAYLVMEHVDGNAVTTHCDTERLTLDERLRLFRVVCDATQHAHQSLIVHRDLKPSNIYVSRAGDVKLLDFGIAKLLEADHPLAHETTNERRALTPAYAAPEQLRGEPVTTAADVYVLGVVLYELVTGQRPSAKRSMAGVPGERDVVTPPSVAVRRRLMAKEDGERFASSNAAAARRTTPARLARRLAGDMDRVVLKALQPEPERRYRSAGQLADDLDRLLAGRPVAAQPDTIAYRARRFIGRHRLGVLMAVVLCVLVVSFAVVAALQARAVAEERDRARVEASRAARVSTLVTDLFKLAEPAVGRGDTITARELLDRGSQRIATELQGDAQTQQALFNALARVYGNLGLHDAAIAVLQRALDLRIDRREDTLARAETLHLLAERHASKNDNAAAERHFREALALRRRLKAPVVEVATTLDALGWLLGVVGKFDEARALMEEGVAIRRSQSGPQDSELISALYKLGLVLHRSGDVARAEALFRESVDVGRGISEPSAAKVTSLLQLASVVADFDGEPAKAEALYREALTMARAIYTGDHQDVATCLDELARNLLHLKRLTEAEPLAREGLEMVLRLHGDHHDETVDAWRTLAGVLRAQGRRDEAERLLRMALTHARSLYGEGNPTMLIVSRSLASVLEEQEKYREALTLRQDELARTIKVLGEADVFVAIGLNGLGRHGLVSGRLDLAETYFKRALGVRQKIHPPNHWRIDEARGMVGVAHMRAGRLTEAESDLKTAYEGLRAHRGPTADETRSARTHLIELYERWNRPDQIQLYRQDAR